jgi:PAS domain S-box-containing protein
MTRKELAQKVLDLETKNMALEGLVAIQQVVQEMVHPQDLERVMQVCLAEVKQMGMDICSMALHLMLNVDQRLIKTFRFSTNGTLSIEESRRATQLTQCWKTGQSTIQADMGANEYRNRIRDRFGGLMIRSFMDVPFSQGVISVQSLAPDPFIEADKEILVRVSGILSAGIARMYELKRVEDRLALERAYQDIAQMTLSSLNLDGVLDNLGVHLVHSGIFNTLSISLVDHEKNESEVVRSYNILADGTTVNNSASACGGRYTLDSTDPGAVAARTRELLVVDGYDARYFKKKPPENNTGRTFYFIPIVKNDKTVAVLATGSHPDKKEDIKEKIQAIQPLFDQVVIAIENAKLFEHSQSEIQNRKMAEEALEKSEYLHRGAIEAAGAVPYIAEYGERERRIEIVGPGMEALTGYTTGSFVVDLWDSIQQEVIPIGHLRGMPLDEIRQKISGGETDTWQIEHHIKTRGGHDKWLLSVGKAEYSEQVKRVVGLGIFFDITEMKANEERLALSQQRYQSIVELAVDPIITIDEHGLIESVNPATDKLFGYAQGELIGQNVKVLMPEPYHSAHDGYLEKHRVAGESKIIGIGRDVVGLRKDNTQFPLLLSISLVQIDNQRKYTGMIRDLTDEKEQAQEVIKLQRLRAATELSAGVSHNLNNILMGIMGPAELLKMQTNDPDILDGLNDVLTSGLRARDLVARLHQSTRMTSVTELEPVNIDLLVTEAVNQTRPKWKDEQESRGQTIEIETHLDAVRPIKAIQSEIHDILVNLIFNAVDAMPEGGKIAIGIEAVEQRVLLTFSDTGIGMDEETKMRIFEPFFTTKTDIGTGLGLSTLYNSVNQFNGKVDVESQAGKGTTFRISFPTWTRPAQPELDISTQTERPSKILIVDDDPLVRRVFSMMLSSHHEVDVFESGERALEKFQPDLYEVAIIDLGMPKMPGDKVADQMRRLDSRLVLGLVSGWLLDEGDSRLSSFDFTLQKPIADIESLRKVIDDAIRLYDSRDEKL